MAETKPSNGLVFSDKKRARQDDGEKGMDLGSADPSLGTGRSNYISGTSFIAGEDNFAKQKRLFGNLIVIQLCYFGKYKSSVGIKWVKMWHRCYGLTNGA